MWVPDRLFPMSGKPMSFITEPRLLNIVPYWEAKLSDVNFMALAQHYGFETHLLDLTNDFMTALFFATCYYDNQKGKFFPLLSDKYSSRS